MCKGEQGLFQDKPFGMTLREIPGLEIISDSLLSWSALAFAYESIIPPRRPELQTLTFINAPMESDFSFHWVHSF